MAPWIAAATGLGRLETLVVVGENQSSVETEETTLLGMLTAETVSGVLGMLVPPVRMMQCSRRQRTVRLG